MVIWSDPKCSDPFRQSMAGCPIVKDVYMSKYLIQANYVGEGHKGLLKDGGSGRRAAVKKTANYRAPGK